MRGLVSRSDPWGGDDRQQGGVLVNSLQPYTSALAGSPRFPMTIHTVGQNIKDLRTKAGGGGLVSATEGRSSGRFFDDMKCLIEIDGGRKEPKPEKNVRSQMAAAECIYRLQQILQNSAECISFVEKSNS